MRSLHLYKRAKMKHTFLIILLALGCVFGYAQNTIQLGRSGNTLNLIEDKAETLQMRLDYASMEIKTINNERGQYAELLLEGGYTDGIVGEPKLPVTQRLIEIPFGAGVEVNVLNYSVQKIDLADYGIERIVPSQAPISKADMPEDAPFVVNEATYMQDKYLGQPLANIEIIGTLRGYRIAKLTVAPVSYNPVQNKIRVCNDIELKINFKHADMALTRDIKAKTRSPYFDIVEKQLVNSGVRDYPDHPDMTRYPIKYVIVADRMFEPYLGEFIEWKTMKGFHVITAYTDEIGSTYNEIQTYLHGLYNAATPDDPAPSFILFVGDTPQIPASTGLSSGKVTDVYYASVDGDYLPEMYYGRFSARTPEQLIPQIEKTLYYEQYQFTDPSYLNNVTLIAGWDDWGAPACGWPTLHYGQENWFNAEHGYNDVALYFGPDDYDGCYVDERIAVSVINYTAHCNETVWGTPSLSSGTINQMHNEGFYPIAIGNCCESSQFGYGECIGESWVRADKKGAVCYLGSAPSTYWYEDEWWSVGAYHITSSNEGQTPSYAQTTMGSYDAMHESGYVTTGSLIYCGNLSVLEAANHNWSNLARYYWEAYNVLGDPSLVGYHTEGQYITASHDPIITIGATSFTIETQPGSFVAISKDGILHGSGLVDDSGIIDLEISPMEENGLAYLVITKPQGIPYIYTLPVGEANQPFPMVTGHEGDPIYIGEATSNSIRIKNVGADMSEPTSITITSEDENMMIVQGTTSIPALAHDEEYTIEPGQIVVKTTDDIEDGEDFHLLATANCGGGAISDFYFTAYKPVFEYQNIQWSDGFTAGYSFDLTVNFVNQGHAPADGVIAYLSTDNPHVTIENEHYYYGHVDVNGTANFIFHITTDDDIDESQSIDFDVLVNANHSIEAETDITLRNQCELVFDLTDTGNNGWDGASVRVNFEDNSEPLNLTIEEGNHYTTSISCTKGMRIMLKWNAGNHDEECGMTVTYADGEPVYELPENPHGTLLITAVDCTVHPDAIEESTESQLSLYPNPASGLLHVESDEIIYEYKIVNVLGQAIATGNIDATQGEIKLNGFVPGLYSIQLTTEFGQTIQKFIVK